MIMRIIKIVYKYNYILLKRKRSFLGIIKGILTLSLSSYYESFNNKIREIDINSYDLIYMEFSKWLFVAKYIKTNAFFSYISQNIFA